MQSINDPYGANSVTIITWLGRIEAVEVDALVAVELVEHRDLLRELGHRRLAHLVIIHLDSNFVPHELYDIEDPKDPIADLNLSRDVVFVELRRELCHQLEPSGRYDAVSPLCHERHLVRVIDHAAAQRRCCLMTPMTAFLG